MRRELARKVLIWCLCQGATLSGEPMIAGFASVLGKQARGTVLLEATQQTKHLTPLQADQHTGVSNTQTTRLNPQQHLKPAELLLAHRQPRQGAPPGTPEPGGVSPLSCRGVSSLYCAYTEKSRKGCYGKPDLRPVLMLVHVVTITNKARHCV